MTNQDRIQHMGTWDLAEFIHGVSANAIVITACKEYCIECEKSEDYCISGIAEWLNAETDQKPGDIEESMKGAGQAAGKQNDIEKIIKLLERASREEAEKQNDIEEIMELLKQAGREETAMVKGILIGMQIKKEAAAGAGQPQEPSGSDADNTRRI